MITNTTQPTHSAVTLLLRGLVKISDPVVDALLVPVGNPAVIILTANG